MRRNLILASTILAIAAFSCSQPTESGDDSPAETPQESTTVEMTEEESLIAGAEAAPDDLKANYNLAVYYYNIGVEVLENMDYDLPFEEAFKEQEKVQEVFGKALPFAEAAHSIDSSHENCITMLAGIHFGLNNMEESHRFQAMLSDEAPSEQHNFSQL